MQNKQKTYIFLHCLIISLLLVFLFGSYYFLLVNLIPFSLFFLKREVK